MVQEAVEASGVPLLEATQMERALDLADAGGPDLTSVVRTRNTRGRETQTPVMVPAILAAVVVGVVGMMMLWRWRRSVRRRSKPPSQKKSIQGPLMPQSSTRMPKVCYAVPAALFPAMIHVTSDYKLHRVRDNEGRAA